MTATVRNVESWATEVEMVAVRIACVDAEVPVTTFPPDRAIEVSGIAEHTVLPVEEDVTEVEVTACPAIGIDIIIRVDAHKVVEINLVGSLVLRLGEVELVCHLVGEEESLLTSLLV